MTRTDKVLPSAVEPSKHPSRRPGSPHSGMDGRILAKMEYLNPGLSKKDRIARQIIEEAEVKALSGPARRGGADQRQYGTVWRCLCVKGYRSWPLCREAIPWNGPA